MKTFIKVIEIWVPDRDRTQLEFGSGLYGALTEFKAASEQQVFAFNEGLPGKAWSQGHPIILKRFEHSYFKRINEAQQAGLTCGIAIPIFAGDFLLAVVIFLCGDDDEKIGAIEVWRNDHDEASLSVMDGYYGALVDFEQRSRHILMAKGYGLPGMVWDTGMPMLMEDISGFTGSMRAFDAQQAGITTGLGIPLINDTTGVYVLTFLSAKATPIAKRIQIWIPDPEGQHLICQQGYSKNINNLAEIFESNTVKKGEGALGRVWLTGMPSITGSQGNEYNPELNALSSMLAIPVIERGHLKAIVSFLF